MGFDSRPAPVSASNHGGSFERVVDESISDALSNIKNRETEAAGRELAGRSGASLTAAVAVVVQHELQRLEDDRTRYLRRVREAATQLRAVSPPPVWLTDADLYDDAGRPR